MADILDTQFADKNVALDDHRVQLGQDINLLQKDPALKRIRVGFGWDSASFNADIVDYDVSLFLLDRNNKTRQDEDFIFYNQMETLGGGIVHEGDSRTGAGDGDDEAILIDLTTLPFDVFSIMFSISIYRGRENRHSMNMMVNSYMRIINADTNIEILRFELDKHIEEKTETAMIAGQINREGPKWHFVPKAEFVDGGLAEIATRYGLIVAQQ